MSVSDRIRYAELSASTFGESGGEVTPPEFALADYDFSVRRQLEDLPKDLTADQLREELKSRGLTVPVGERAYTYRPSVHISGNDLVRGLPATEIDEFVDTYPAAVKKASDDGKSLPRVLTGKESGFSQAQLERFADNLDRVAGREGYGEGGSFGTSLDLQRREVALYSNDKAVALDAALPSWAVSGGGVGAQAALRSVAESGFDVNKGKTFFRGASEHVNPDYVVGYSPERLSGHVKSLHAETQAFYKKKYATKTNPNPDLSMKTIPVRRAIGGHVEAYTPAGMESWTTDGRTVTRFGKMMSNRKGEYSALKAEVSVTDIVWSYESVAGKYGWPPENELKGKREHVVLGGALRNVTVERLND